MDGVRRPRPRGCAETPIIRLTVYRVASFTKNPAEGNPAGVVLGAGDLGDAGFRRVATLADATETAFLDRIDPERWRVRYFAPACEVDFCGHATLAAVGTLARASMLPGLGTTFETKVGDVRVFRDTGRHEVGWMIQRPPEFADVAATDAELAAAVGIAVDDVGREIRPVLATTGLWTLLLPVVSLDALTRARSAESLPALGARLGAGSVHLFTFETGDPLADVRARNFAFGYGIPEDPVTGSANGALGAYLHRLGRGRPQITVSQGTEVGRPGRALVVVESGQVIVGGPTAAIETREIEVDPG